MSSSERLRLREVRAAFCLVGEVKELGTDPHDWWPHLLQGLCQLTGAASAIGGELEGLFFVNPRIHVLGNFFAQFNDDDVLRFMHFMVHEKWKMIDEGGEGYYRLRGQGALLNVRTNEQMMALHRWRRSEMFNDYFRPSRIDDRMYSFCKAPNGRRDVVDLWNGITLFRGLGARPFTARDRRLLRLVHGELRPLIGSKLASLRGSAPRSLSPRLRQTLDLLLLGRSEKQISCESGLAKSTVSEYIANLYHRYGVHTRAELMARFLQWNATRRGDKAASHIPTDSSPGPSEPDQ